MDLGKQLKKARLEAGLSQRALCGDLITRNMLSQIENGTALPSLPTLEILAQRLQKPVGYFFGESLPSPEESPLEPAWLALEAGNPEEAQALLEASGPAGLREKKLLKSLILLTLAEKAAGENRNPYAAALLQQVRPQKLFPELEARRNLLMGEVQPDQAAYWAGKLPSRDRELMLRALAVLPEDPQRAGQLLDGADNRKDPDWAMLRGEAYLQQKLYSQAADCFRLAEDDYPLETAGKLEICCREQGDFKGAYHYACLQK